jgi:hypothetical protein
MEQRSDERPIPITIALSLAKASTVLNPMPEVAPLTTKVFVDKSFNIFHPLTFQFHSVLKDYHLQGWKNNNQRVEKGGGILLDKCKLIGFFLKFGQFS